MCRAVPFLGCLKIKKGNKLEGCLKGRSSCQLLVRPPESLNQVANIQRYPAISSAKDNAGCVASGAYRYRKITLPGNPKAHQCGFSNRFRTKPCRDRPIPTLSRIQSNWLCVLTLEVQSVSCTSSSIDSASVPEQS